MKKIISILSLLLVIFSLVPMSLSAAATTQPVIWVDTDGDGHDEYTDSLGNTWITLTIDEDGNRLILSEKTLGVVEFEDEFNGGFPDTTTVYNDYATSDLKAEMDMFYNGGDSETKVNDTVYYLAPELKAIAQPVVLPDDEVVTFAENDPTTPDLDESAFIASATGGMSYVDESGQTTCFALSISETITYLANGVVTPGVEIPSMATEHAPGANFAATGEDYDGVDTYPKPGEPSVDHPTNGGTGWTTRSAADSNYDVAKINSTGLTGRDHVDNNSGFRPALWVSEADSDADGISDTEEAKLGTKPLVADSDEDGLKDGEEVTLGTKPLVGDSDEDGLKDGEEVTLGTKPLVDDSDNDGLKDGEEVTLGTKPLVDDSDNDGLKDGEEVASGTDPLDTNIDEDGLNDGEEVANDTDSSAEEKMDNGEETLAETGSAPFVLGIAIAISAFAVAMYTKFRTTK